MNLKSLGIDTQKALFINRSVPELIEQAVGRAEAVIAESGALVAKTFDRTGRSPQDKFIVRDSATQDRVWWGPNQPADQKTFDSIWEKAVGHLGGRDIFLTDAWACADPANRIGVRVISELAWHALFARQLFRKPLAGELEGFKPDWTVVSVPNLKVEAAEEGTNSEVFVAIDFSRQRVLIVGTHYAGEIKKSIFTVLNYLLPLRGVLPMHCSANVGDSGDVALFFGLSGTGKTTLSADPKRRLIGDDEHGWSDDGVFNFEGGCYAKCIRLSKEREPQIWEAIRFGSVVENVVVDPATRKVDYDDDSITENTRAAYPLEFIPGAMEQGMAGHAETIVFLTADASGVLPPVAILDEDHAAYHFLSGFTSKLAGTEAGLGKEPQATFSTCFASPFLPLHPTTYARMLVERIRTHGARVFMVNTGWSGGPYGVGERIDLPATRRIVGAAVSGELDKVETRRDMIFGFEVPIAVEGVQDQILDPRQSWPDGAAYDAKAKELATKFQENFDRFKGEVSTEILDAGPRL